MLARLSIREWSGRKVDRNVNAEIEANYKTKGKAGNYNKILVEKTALTVISCIRSQARTYHNTKTLPWGEDGTRILPSTLYLEYINHMRNLSDRFNVAVNDFLNSYSDCVDSARTRLSSLFNEHEYPELGRLKGKYEFRINITPMLDEQDFRVNLSDEEKAKVQADIAQFVESKRKTANQDLWNRLYEVAAKASEKLSDPEATFRDSLILNIRELLDLLPSLNIDEDKKLYKAAHEVQKKLAKFEPQELRNDREKRQKVANDAKKILESMAGYLG